MPWRKLIVNMKISSEAKVGLIGIATLVVLIWGINYLKGRNILASTYTLYAHYEDSGGLETSAPVLLNGIKIGYVDAIYLQPEAVHPVEIALHIEKSYPLRIGSSAVLISADLLGSKAIRIESSKKDGLLSDQDTILSSTEPDLFSSIAEQAGPVMQQIGQLASSLDTLVGKMDDLLSSKASENTLEHLSHITASLKTALEPGGSLHQSFNNLESFSSLLADQGDEIASMTSHLNSVSEALDSAGIDKLTEELTAAAGQFNLLLEQLNSGEGSAGKLIYSDTLYYHLENLVSDLDSLILDLNENPKDYVQFSLFGKSQK
jgi:phospholipid/cholesterol/gamma-HCH transport system substrate-binding protein